MNENKIEAYLAAELNTEELLELEKEISADSELYQEFISQFRIDHALNVMLSDGHEDRSVTKSVLTVLGFGSKKDFKKSVVNTIKIRRGAMSSITSAKSGAAARRPSKRRVWRVAMAAAATIALVFGGIRGMQRYRSSVLGIASFEKTTDGVMVLRQDRKFRAVKNMVIQNGDVIQTVSKAGGMMRYRDGSILTVKPDSSLTLSLKGKAKQVALRQGGIEADVVKQSRRSPMLFVTRHAEIRILGTKINLNSVKGRTDVATISGKVRVKNRRSEAEETISAGQTAEVFIGSDEIGVDVYKKDPSLIGWWRFDELEGSRSMDSSGHGFHGDIVFAEWKAVERGGCLDFSKKDSQVEIDFRNHRESFQAGTLSCLFKLSPTKRTPPGGNICRLGFAGRWGLRVWEMSGTGKLSLRVGGEVEEQGKQFRQVLNMKNPIITSNNQWHHMAVTYEGMRVSLYVDGYLVAQVFAKESFPELEYLRLGKQGGLGFSRIFGGRLDEVQLYSRALDAAEVKELAEANQ
ncbi:LamG-like jellyroll fold domain-containing protein [Verrucomicrobiota bacterium]